MSRGQFLNTTGDTSLKSQSGQIAVVVFLIMAVLLVVGLSLATRTSQEIELAGQQEDTTRVFNAAESGIEDALSQEGNFQGGLLPSPTPIVDTTAQTSTQVTITEEDEFTNTYQPGMSATVFTDTSTDRDVKIRWIGTNATPPEADCSSVLVITAYIKSNSTYSAQHYGVRALDPCTDFDSRFSVNGVSESSDSNYLYEYSLDVPVGTEMLRIKPLYASTSISVSGNALGNQMHTIRSEAKDLSTGNTEVRAVEVTRTRPAPPLIFDYALYSGGTLTK